MPRHKSWLCFDDRQTRSRCHSPGQSHHWCPDEGWEEAPSPNTLGGAVQTLGNCLKCFTAKSLSNIQKLPAWKSRTATKMETVALMTLGQQKYLFLWTTIHNISMIYELTDQISNSWHSTQGPAETSLPSSFGVQVRTKSFTRICSGATVSSGLKAVWARFYTCCRVSFQVWSRISMSGWFLTWKENVHSCQRQSCHCRI